MKRFILYSMIWLGLSLAVVPVQAEEVSETEIYIIELINEIRRDPVSYAQKLGYDTDSLKTQLPWLDSIGGEGLPALTPEDALFEKAAILNQGDGEESSTPETEYMVSADTGAVISFYNFIPPKDAALIVIENLFKAELNPDRKDSLYICSAEFDLIGSAFDTGAITATGQNAYFATLVFASASSVETQEQSSHETNQISQSELSEANAYIIELVNKIRRDPVWYAKKLGYDTDSLKAQLPWLDSIGWKELPVLAPEDTLFKKAGILNQVDGEETQEAEESSRPETEYMISADTGPVFSFSNFIAPKDAALTVIEDLFKDELSRKDPRDICSAEFDLIGSAFDAGVLTATGQNTYFATLVFASASPVKTQRQLLHVINQIRKDPSPETIQTYLKKIPDNGELLKNMLFSWGIQERSYPPLFPNSILDNTAGAYFDPAPEDDPDTEIDESTLLSSVSQRVQDLGYQGTNIEELVVRTRYEQENHLAPASEIINDLLTNQADQAPLKESLIFTEDVDEAGLHLDFQYRQLDVVVKVALDLGSSASSEDEKPQIYGVVYSDDDGNNVYTPGEEIADRKVSVYHKTGMLKGQAVTDSSGYWSVSLHAGNYVLEITSGEDVVWSEPYSMEQDDFVAIDISGS